MTAWLLQLSEAELSKASSFQLRTYQDLSPPVYPFFYLTLSAYVSSRGYGPESIVVVAAAVAVQPLPLLLLLLVIAAC